ncbi:hypothetical protein HK102_000381 [Quaeritorhiza haematococci]|nr:hypothetical protein HK102_000381 [Quaeritorhiza haematococci]
MDGYQERPSYEYQSRSRGNSFDSKHSPPGMRSTGSASSNLSKSPDAVWKARNLGVSDPVSNPGEFDSETTLVDTIELYRRI